MFDELYEDAIEGVETIDGKILMVINGDDLNYSDGVYMQYGLSRIIKCLNSYRDILNALSNGHVTVGHLKGLGLV